MRRGASGAYGEAFENIYLEYHILRYLGNAKGTFGEHVSPHGEAQEIRHVLTYDIVLIQNMELDSHYLSHPQDLKYYDMF